MVEIQNTNIIDKISEKIKESNTNILPKTISNSIVPIIDVGENIDSYVVESTANASSGTLTMLTTPSDKDFYLTSVTLGLNKNSACDLGTGSLNVTVVINGASKIILYLPTITLTAQNDVVVLSLPTPIKLDRSSSITYSGSFSAGVCLRSGNITAYTTDTLEK